MIEPILLTIFGETLNPESGVDRYGTTDETCLYPASWGEKTHEKDVVGVHNICNGTIQLIKVSITHNAMRCNHCGLRIIVPNYIDNYRELRAWFHGLSHRTLAEKAKE